MDEKGFDYLNVIPLVDVMLVLLTIVLTTSTFIATGGIQVELPKASVSEDAAALHPRTIVINREGRLWLDSAEVALGGLEAALAGVGRNTPLIVRADKHLSLQMFVDVYEAIKRLGFTTLSLQTEQQP
ncbi:Biopolymer transport protein ExbD/TolR [Desulfobulbus propionicus DSM 2032]|uniref:Biopolymer transport protein ExbD/TolR n=1 Tax=Desulfobulbus propionicus (strain ATCC 33891 / DSM 2032 / VKM B-1956 / 1pr3) TaxID=577650 RepID=A0A7U3YLN3_DESPD|nr:biopolymer transporter ExbD [Desulfobulbus propionicus]ADW17660.1 Biopolymer transport protein ExbD/TolR [Desulfobulbus propionicus DSM 2032]